MPQAKIYSLEKNLQDLARKLESKREGATPTVSTQNKKTQSKEECSSPFIKKQEESKRKYEELRSKMRSREREGIASPSERCLVREFKDEENNYLNDRADLYFFACILLIVMLIAYTFEAWFICKCWLDTRKLPHPGLLLGTIVGGMLVADTIFYSKKSAIEAEILTELEGIYKTEEENMKICLKDEDKKTSCPSSIYLENENAPSLDNPPVAKLSTLKISNPTSQDPGPFLV